MLHMSPQLDPPRALQTAPVKLRLTELRACSLFSGQPQSRTRLPLCAAMHIVF